MADNKSGEDNHSVSEGSSQVVGDSESEVYIYKLCVYNIKQKKFQQTNILPFIFHDETLIQNAYIIIDMTCMHCIYIIFVIYACSIYSNYLHIMPIHCTFTM